MGKSQWWDSGLFCVCLAAACAAVSAETFSTSAERDALIRQAGEAPTDAARLDALRTLRDAVADDATRAAETDCLIAWVGEWMTNPRLEFYWRDFRKNEDYDFGVRENSPLFPLTHLYKARMLVWGILEYGGYANPERYAKARALRLADLFEHLWTGVNERGHLQFKSTYFSVDKVDLREDRACDTVYHPRAVQPTLLLWQRTGDARLGRLFSAWMDTWVDAAARGAR